MDERTSKDDEFRPTPGSADERCLEAVRPFCAGRRVDESGLRRAREVCSNVETTTQFGQFEKWLGQGRELAIAPFGSLKTSQKV